ncbi:carbonic anhydrase 12 isoform X3 [Hyla sarda]|uniref:carbonic anhydrase 12 isoform X3 n=1 Tax=Hyla sarda TaxID=327740 RepID=UPI0024C374C9|nr:carbonic anhydrase 12 isoform X3 [Hyla sarda]
MRPHFLLSTELCHLHYRSPLYCDGTNNTNTGSVKTTVVGHIGPKPQQQNANPKCVGNIANAIYDNFQEMSKHSREEIRHSWAYTGNDGENSWATKYSFCGGVYQSPLDFHGSILQYDSTLKPIQLYGYNASSTDYFTISNNGHTVSMSLLPSMYLEIPPFRYIASQLHFHWGSLADQKGSEHCIGGRRYPAEMHIVHYNSKYADVSTAMEAADGLAVLGILIEIGSFNPSYDKIISQLTNIKYKGQNIQIPGFNVQHLIPERLDEYYRYEGSLTTPPCNPSVLWSVFRNHVFISEEQLLLLETALYCTGQNSSAPIEMVDNYRRLQQEGDRRVSVSFREGIVLAVTLACVLGTVVLTAVTCWLFQRKKRGKETKKVVYSPAVPMEENTSKISTNERIIS